MTEQALAEDRSAEDVGVQRPPQVEHPAGVETRPGMDDVEGQIALHQVGAAQAEQEPDEAAPVVAAQAHPLEPQNLEQGPHIVGEGLLLIAAGRCLRPAESRADRGR